MSHGERIQMEMSDRGMSIRALAERLGWSKSKVCRVVLDQHSLLVDELDQLALVLDLDVRLFFKNAK